MRPTRSFLVAVATACALLGSPTVLPGATKPPAPAAPPAPTSPAATGNVSGALANVDGSNMKVSVRAKDSAMTFLTVTEGTVITRAGKPATLDDLHSGDSVQAAYVTTSSGDQVATTITATAAKPKSGKGKRK